MKRIYSALPVLTSALLLLCALLAGGVTAYAGETPGAGPDANAPIQQTVLVDPAAPTGPDSPMDPIDPVDPVAPTDPTGPVTPTDPVDPVPPIDPPGPIDPVDPVDPGTPSDPVQPANPGTPTEPVQPVTPVEPTDPADSASPAEPAKPTEPETPAEPTAPVKPTNTETPVKPATPAEPTASIGTAAVAEQPAQEPAALEEPAPAPAADPATPADADAQVLAGSKKPTGWQEIGGQWYYYNKDGKVATGSFEAGGNWYYSNQNGVRQTGLINAEGIGTLYAGADGALGRGWHDTTYGSYYFGDNYVAVTGWQEVDGATRWFDPATAMARQGIIQDGEDYFFYSRGVAAQHLGFWYEGGYNYYFGNPGAAAYKGVFNIGTDYFFAFPDATVRSGLMWDYAADGLRYGDGNTLFLAQNEWVSVADKGSYYFDGNALAVSGDQVVGGVNCYFDPETYIAADGILQREDGGHYFYNRGQNNAYGFVYTGGYNYYFGQPGGPAYTGIFTVGGKAFYAFPDGTIRSGKMYYEEADNYIYGDPGTLWLAQNEWVTPGDGYRYYYDNLYLLAAQETAPQQVTKPEAPATKPETPAKPEPAAPGNVSGELEYYAREVYRLVNVERAKAGLNTLAYLPNLSQLAMVRAEETADVFDHTRPDGRSCFSVYADANYSYSVAGENLARGYHTPAAAMDAWMNSQGHRENILRSNFTQIGVAVYQVDGRIYCTQLFTKNFKWMG